MNDHDLAISAKIGMIEFMLEVLMANHVANMDQARSDSFKAELASRSSYLRFGILDAEYLQALATRVQRECEKFVAKVSEREQDFRCS